MWINIGSASWRECDRGGENEQILGEKFSYLWNNLIRTQTFQKNNSQHPETPASCSKTTSKCYRGPIFWTFSNLCFWCEKLKLKIPICRSFLAFSTKLKHQKPQTVCVLCFFWVEFTIFLCRKRKRLQLPVLSIRVGCWSIEFRLTELGQQNLAGRTQFLRGW